MRQERTGYVDVAKGVAILCIIIGHLDSFAIRRVVFTFHVPIFYLITGFYISAKRTRAAFFRRKLRTLIVPYAVTCCVIVAGAAAINALRTDGPGTGRVALDWTYAALYGAGNSYTEPFSIKGIGAIWFLWATFWGSCALRVLLDMKDRYRPLAVLGILLACCWSKKLCWLPLSIQAGGPALLYMYIGSLFRQAQGSLRSLRAECRTALVLGALVVWVSFMVDFQSFSLARCDLGRGAVDIFGSLCGCAVVLLAARAVEVHCPVPARCLAYLGRYSLLTLCAHIVELDIFPWDILKGAVASLGAPYVAYQIALVLGKLGWSVAVTVLLSRWEPARRLFGYGPRRSADLSKSVVTE